MVIMIMVVVLAVMTYIGEEHNLCWFYSLICILRKKSQYVIASLLPVLSTCPTDYFYYCPKELYMILS